ncbi:hypothetical protein SEPCBS57363_001598 [Sporothrix epigloea]|uniref:Uncharacterized protein n=1 Tax=Sporothrix epigloea TaxID=1892477 RepID=A0ABP0DDS6_9PEZI
MTRLGPLTSQALGRSPYDIIVPGTGEANPREPLQTYDERGRPYNAETRRVNRNIIRAHNEVMQVIGVAEPESLLTAENETNKQLIQQLHEDRLGNRLYKPLRIISAVGLWGIEPLRQRVLLFRKYDEYPPWTHFRQDYGAVSMLRTLAVGLTASLTDNYLRQLSRIWKTNKQNLWSVRPGGYVLVARCMSNFPSTLLARPLYPRADYKRGRRILWYVRVHLQIFTCLQRLGILSPSPILPRPLFFVPFSGHSPISCAAPFPKSFTFASVVEWLFQAALGTIPFAAFCCYREVRDHLMHHLDYIIYDSLDTPSNPPVRRPISEYDPFTGEWRPAGLSMVMALPPRPPVPPPPPAMEPPSRPRGERPAVPPPPPESQRPFTNVFSTDNNNDDNTAGQQTAISGDGGSPAEPGSLSAVMPAPVEPSASPLPGSPETVRRRRNTVTSGGDGDRDNSDEEDFELSATLISFDVEAGPGVDAPANAWSAELHQAAAVSIGFESTEVYTGGADDNGLGLDNDVFNDSRHRGGRQPGSYIRGVYYPNGLTPFYSDTMLSRLPATIFSASAASVGVSLLMTECESAMVQLLARSWRIQHRLPVDDLYSVSPLLLLPGFFGNHALPLNAANHYTFVILLETAVQATATLVTLGLAWLFRGSQVKWTVWQTVREKLWYGAGGTNESSGAVV